MKNESGLEQISGSLTATGVATIIANIAGGPVAALLPLLSHTLANNRHKKRVEDALKDIEGQLSKMGDKITHITDAQYKFINESVITILHSPDDKKIEYLKEGIKKSAAAERLNLHQAGLISRILRDITVEELTFLIECRGNKILFHETLISGCLNILKLSTDAERANGLIALGLLTKETPEGIWDDHGVHVFTPISEQLIELVTK